MFSNLFLILGIPENEVRVYLTLAEVGKAPASLIAKRTGIPRSTAYTNLEALGRRGLVSIEETSGVTLYVANQPSVLRYMLIDERAKQESALREKEAAVEELLPLLSTVFKSSNYSVPKLLFFEGTANVEAMLYEYGPLWQRSIAQYDSTWWGYQDHHLVATYRVWLDRYWAGMEEQERICLFSNQSELEKSLKDRVARRTIKTTDPRFPFSSTIWVLGDYVVTIMTRQQPHYAVQLQDAVLAANHRSIFQLLWELVPEAKEAGKAQRKRD